MRRYFPLRRDGCFEVEHRHSVTHLGLDLAATDDLALARSVVQVASEQSCPRQLGIELSHQGFEKTSRLPFTHQGGI